MAAATIAVTEIAATAEVMTVAVKQVNSCYNSSTAEGAVCSSGSNYVSTAMVPIFEIFALFSFSTMAAVSVAAAVTLLAPVAASILVACSSVGDCSSS